MTALERNRAIRDVSLPTTDQTSRAVLALAGVFSRHAGMTAAIELARNLAQCILSMQATGDETPTANVIREVLEGRRKNWPESAWGSLTDAGVDTLSALGA